MDRQEKSRPKANRVGPRRATVDHVTRMAPVPRPDTSAKRGKARPERMPNGDPNSLTLWGAEEFDG
jgi:hypothetical protein